MYNNKHFLQLNKSLNKPGVLTEFYIKNIHSNTSPQTLDLYEQSMFWYAKRFKYTQGLNMNSQAIDNYTKSFLTPQSVNPKWDLNLNSLFFYYSTVLDLTYLHNSNLEHYSLGTKSLYNRVGTGFWEIKYINSLNPIYKFILFFITPNNYYTDLNNYIILRIGSIAPNFNIDFIENFNYQTRRNIDYNLDFSEQTIFSTGFNALFGTHVANSIVFDNNTMPVFHNIFKQEYL